MSHSVIEPGSDRSFGVVFAFVFAFIGGWPLLGGEPLRQWAIGLAALFLFIAFIRPKTLHPLNVIWFRFGILLGRVVAPIVMAILYFVAVTPTAFVMRALGHDLLNLKTSKGAASYWVVRDPPDPERNSMKNQF